MWECKVGETAKQNILLNAAKKEFSIYEILCIIYEDLHESIVSLYCCGLPGWFLQSQDEDHLKSEHHDFWLFYYSNASLP